MKATTHENQWYGRIEIKKAYNETSDAILLSDGFFSLSLVAAHDDDDYMP